VNAGNQKLQTLMILRHAKAVPWYPGVDDFGRPLSEIGAGHAQKVANWMCEHLQLPECILCSPSQRTRETLAPLLALHSELGPLTRFESEIYGASSSTLHSLIDFGFVEADRLLIVGHNPGFEMLVFDVIAASQYHKIRRLATGTLVVVDFEPAWDQGSGQGILRHKVRGKKL
jgi:phosphohistidine phosphatase